MSYISFTFKLESYEIEELSKYLVKIIDIRISLSVTQT